MFDFPSFRAFHESIKIAKFKGSNIEFTMLENSTSLNNRCWCIKLAKIKGAKITLSTQWQTFRAASLKVLQ